MPGATEDLCQFPALTHLTRKEEHPVRDWSLMFAVVEETISSSAAFPSCSRRHLALCVDWDLEVTNISKRSSTTTIHHEAVPTKSPLRSGSEDENHANGLNRFIAGSPLQVVLESQCKQWPVELVKLLRELHGGQEGRIMTRHGISPKSRVFSNRHSLSQVLIHTFDARGYRVGPSAK